MRNVLLAAALLLTPALAWSASRFERPVIKVADEKAYQFHKLDDVEYPTLSNQHFEVSCLVYRGTEDYYVEISIKNQTSEPVAIPYDFVTFTKPGYSVFRTDSMQMAARLATAAGARFQPTPPPYVPPTYNTTVDATATTYGNQTSVSGTATTTADYSGQAGANVGNAIGNAIAARRFYKAQRNAIMFSQFLATHVQTNMDLPLQPGQTRTIVATFSQTKAKKRPFDVDIKLADATFHFAYKE